MKVAITSAHPREIEADAAVQPFIAPFGGDEPLARNLTARGSDLIVPDPLSLTWLEARRLAAPRLVMACLGEEADLQPASGHNGSSSQTADAVASAEVHRLLGAAIERGCFENDVNHVVLAPGRDVDTASIVEGMLLRGYAAMEFRRKDIATTLDKITVCVTDDETHKRVKERVTVTKARNVARALADLPGNVGNPAGIEGRLRKLAKRAGLKMTTLDVAALRDLGMGLMLGVAAGGGDPGCLVVLEHRVDRRRPTLVLVGKGLTHDTGGYNLKTTHDLHELTYDKAGAMAVAGAMEAIARLKVDANVVALLPLVENCVDAHAYKPGDILVAMDKTTVYVDNTDAEGRLVLADCLTYAKRFRPRLVIDIATLTGSCSAALGSAFAGLYSNDDAGRDLLLEAGNQSGELVWPMPIHDTHRSNLQHHKAQICNTGPRAGQASSAAAFLSHFVRYPWVHVDMAGKAASPIGRGACGRGATGFGVGLLTRAAQRFAEGHPAAKKREGRR